MTTVAPSSLRLPNAPGSDRWPPELRLLLRDDAGGILAAAAEAAGGQLRRWRPRQVTHQPGRSTVVQYRAEVAWPDGGLTDETIVAATGARIPEGAAVLDDGTTHVAVWRWPVDPSLPGLSVALAVPTRSCLASSSSATCGGYDFDPGSNVLVPAQEARREDHRDCERHGLPPLGLTRARGSSSCAGKLVRSQAWRSGLAKKWGSTRVDQACARALEAEAVDVNLVALMLERAKEDVPAETRPGSNVVQGRFARHPSEFAVESGEAR